MSEQQLTRAIIDAVNASGLAYVWRNQAGRVKVKGGWMQLAPEGTPDIVGKPVDALLAAGGER